MASRKFWLLAIILAVGPAIAAQSPTYGVGRTPTAAEIKAWDIAISPDGHELPDGFGGAAEGSMLYVSKGCAGCHGRTGSEGPAPTLIKSNGTTKSATPCLNPCVNDNNTITLHSPFATVIFDYINRGMPLGKEGSLTPNEVYSIVAF